MEMDLKKLIYDAANDIKSKTLEEELKDYENHAKFKSMRESCKRFHILAWHLVMASVPRTESDAQHVIDEVKKSAAETWGNDGQKTLAELGITTKKDIVDMLSIALEHGILCGNPVKCPDGELY
jgi:hypothetical protein